ncbi:MAG: threonine synthase [Selenomonas sp.]|uniref:threonine synthase n=1 Tax=Selenomonas sp. TaxID=2053611 RepID=UPI0025CE6335|nr:threonine synthase [Selenomonas sp.]MCI6086228.1 threonine synthase [Selenomonas sp.]MDY4417090.1 threonine synthase [Selenomonas sp.]
MKYISTRGGAEHLTSAEAILQGLSENGGLFVPEELPKVAPSFIEALVPLAYEERAVRVLQAFLTDYSEDELRGCVTRAYGGGKFDTERRAPTKLLQTHNVLELWHGPTSAFKDMALQLLPQLLSTALAKTGEQDDVLILVATSGDTGKAALEGFRDVPQTKIMVFYPEGGVSRIQHLQMTTQEGGNVNVTAVRGNFDDAQTGVKRIFGDKAFGKELAAVGVKLSSANSINWGRLVPQIVYYFSAYADLLVAGRITMGDAVNFCVPTGNFGDILAGFYAKCMGLPVGRLVCASNKNNVLTDFLTTGTYNRNRAFYQTITPSMDILISSNLERLLYHMSGSTAAVAGWMKALAETGTYTIPGDLLAKIQETFAAGWADEDATKAAIKEAYDTEGYIPDTHTAVAWQVAEAYQKETGDTRPMVVVSTASPYKFNGSVLAALGHETAGKDEFALLDELAFMNSDPTPAGLASLKTKTVRHQDVCEREEMRAFVRAFADK